MLSPESWAKALDQAKHTSAKRIRTNHDCGAGRTLTVSIDEKGAHAWCFRCNDKGWLPPEPVPLAVRLARLADQNKADLKVQQAVGLPTDGVKVWADWPEPARLWLLKAGLCAADLPRLRAYYHTPTLRVVLPVFRGSEPVFWQARALDGRVPKYLAPDISKASVIAKYGSGPSITLTEDLLSAYKLPTL